MLVYNPNYLLQTTKSITSGLNEPTGVVDSKGNVYVANWTGNFSTSYVNQYSSAGVLNTRFSITDGINQPVAITIDGVDDLYVVNLPNVTIYPLADTINRPSLLKTFTFDAGGCMPLWCALAVHAGDFMSAH